MIHNQRVKALFFLLTHPSVLHQGHFLFPEVCPCSRRSFPVPERSLDNSRQPLNRGDAYPFPMLFAPSEHKIENFVRFYPPRPPFSGISSTKSRILCAFSLRNPCFQAFRAQNRHFCAREEWEMASGSVKVTFLQFTAHVSKTQMPHNLIINF